MYLRFLKSVFRKAMLTEIQTQQIIRSELNYRTSRSGGKGGQNVNKVESKVEISFDVANSSALTDHQKHLILGKLGESGPILQIISEKHRSQLENKREAQEKLIEQLQKFLKIRKKRTATKPTKSSQRKRIEKKKAHSERKARRRKPE